MQTEGRSDSERSHGGSQGEQRACRGAESEPLKSDLRSIRVRGRERALTGAPPRASSTGLVQQDGEATQCRQSNLRNVMSEVTSPRTRQYEMSPPPDRPLPAACTFHRRLPDARRDVVDRPGENRARRSTSGEASHADERPGGLWSAVPGARRRCTPSEHLLNPGIHSWPPAVPITPGPATPRLRSRCHARGHPDHPVGRQGGGP